MKPFDNQNIKSLKRTILLILLLSPFSLAAQWSNWIAPPEADTIQNPLKDDASAAEAGQQLFSSICFVCHGDHGKGDGMNAPSLAKAPANLTSARVQRQSDGILFWKISEGNPPMLSFKSSLSEEQRWQVIAYVRKLAVLYPDEPNATAEDTPASESEEQSTASEEVQADEALAITSNPYDKMNGQEIFQNVCAACHSIGKGQLIGPDLKNVEQRHTRSWMYKWIKSSQSMVKSGDADAIKLFNDNNKIVMPDQDISNNKIDEILAFIQSKSNDEPLQVSSIIPNESNTMVSNPSSSKSLGLVEYLIVTIFLISLLVIILAFFQLNQMIKMLIQ